MKRSSSKGQIAVILGLIMPVLVGAISLVTDIGVMYYNHLEMQKAADAAVLAGASVLSDQGSSAAIGTAQQYAEMNGIGASEIVSTTVASGNTSITLAANRTLPYMFGRVLGLTNATIGVTASAAPQYPPTTVNAPTQTASAGGDNNGNTGSYGTSTGQYELLPIGLNSTTTYIAGSKITLQQGQIQPGNWDLLALGGVGGNNLRNNIADGYGGMVSVSDWVTTEPGKKVGPVDQGVQDRLNTANSVDPGGTYSSHTATDPRLVVLPVVNWAGQGRTSVQVVSFATLWIDSYSGGQISAHMISNVIPGTFGNPNSTAPDFGAKGSPILIN
jgi:Flp pilus assembly protein TadG